MNNNGVKKICVVTGSRAEYGLLYWLIKAILAEPTFKLQLMVTGSHLSPEFGLTYREIERDFSIDKKIEILLSSDTAVGIAKSMGLAQISFAEAFAECSPDLLIVLGDRYEIFAAASAAMVARIPIGHCHGGEATEGAIDEAMRHAITKMSHLHFTAAEEYRHRVIQLGEQPQWVFNVGGLGIENIKKLKLLAREEFEKSIGFKLGVKNLLITFHPATLENATAQNQFQELLFALDQLSQTHFIFTKANADGDGRLINQMIDEYVAQRAHSAVAFTSMGQLRYLSALQYVDGVVGNSSSGIIEAPTFKIGTINIGDRQKGRLRALSVIDVAPTAQDIQQALDQLYSAEFQNGLQKTQNPYGEGFASLKIMDVLKTTDFSQLLKKSFYDVMT